jgi:hypothetical protein
MTKGWPARAVVPIAVVLALATTGCLAAKSYVDPTLGRTSYSDFQPQGRAKAGRASSRIPDEGKAEPSEVEPPERQGIDRLEIVMDNFGDAGAAVAKGIGTGLTLGLAGSTVTDGYVFLATYTPLGKAPVTKEYRHAIHSTVGVKAGPPGLEPMSVQAAFDRVLEELVLRLLLDLRVGEHL